MQKIDLTILTRNICSEYEYCVHVVILLLSKIHQSILCSDKVTQRHSISTLYTCCVRTRKRVPRYWKISNLLITPITYLDCTVLHWQSACESGILCSVSPSQGILSKTWESPTSHELFFAKRWFSTYHGKRIGLVMVMTLFIFLLYGASIPFVISDPSPQDARWTPNPNNKDYNNWTSETCERL